MRCRTLRFCCPFMITACVVVFPSFWSPTARSQGPDAAAGQGSRALDLNDGRFVTMGETPHLDLKETTVELWFQADFDAGPGYNPCLIAKRATGDHRQTRFSMHVWNDYSCLALWNGQQVMQAYAEDGPLQRGRWYHLALTATAAGVQIYLDGVACRTEPSSGTFNFAQAKRPLSIGSFVGVMRTYQVGTLHTVSTLR